MISVVVCSRNNQMLAQLLKNIESTIGVPYEIQSIDNSQKNTGICEVYNLGAERSLYDIICFVHEDVKFHTKDWGKKVLDTLADSSIGIIGVAGGQVKTKNHSSWWSPYTYRRMNLIQGFADKNYTIVDSYNPSKDTLSDVVTLDGVWLCCRKEIWKETKFDPITFKGFHFYDIDFSMQVFQAGYRVCVVYDILLEHFSAGTLSTSWLEASVLFSRKWHAKLPASIHSFNSYQWKKLEYESCRELIRIMLALNVKNWLLFQYLIKYWFSNSQGWTAGKLIKERLRTILPSSILSAFSVKK